uniref:Putative metalloprotease yebA n=1 Tax=Lygus hesperus TaxID=30085 RepID=A0A0A9WM59_LYGHE
MQRRWDRKLRTIVEHCQHTLVSETISSLYNLQHDIYVEYVHLQPRTICVHKGQRIHRGDIVGYSGASGFTPEPHVHMQVTVSADKSAPTIPFVLRSRRCQDVYMPYAGLHVSVDGPVQNSTE